MALAVIQPNRLDVSAKDKVWDYSAALLRCDTPIDPTDAANKAYVDAQIAGEDIWDRTGTTISPANVGDLLSVEEVNASDDIKITDSTKGFVLYDGSNYQRITADSNGNLYTEQI